MKVKLIVAAIFLFSLGACTQKTCPTYAKKDTKELKTAEERI